MNVKKKEKVIRNQHKFSKNKSCQTESTSPFFFFFMGMIRLVEQEKATDILCFEFSKMCGEKSHLSTE